MATKYSYYLKIDGIRGDAVTKHYDGWIELLSFSFGNTRSNVIGKSPVNALNITVDDSNTFLALANAIMANKHFPQVILAVKKDNSEIGRFTFKHAVFSGYTNGGSDGSERYYYSFDMFFSEMKSLHGSALIAQPLTKSQLAKSR